MVGYLGGSCTLPPGTGPGGGGGGGGRSGAFVDLRLSMITNTNTNTIRRPARPGGVVYRWAPASENLLEAKRTLSDPDCVEKNLVNDKVHLYSYMLGPQLPPDVDVRRGMPWHGMALHGRKSWTWSARWPPNGPQMPGPGTGGSNLGASNGARAPHSTAAAAAAASHPRPHYPR